MVEDVEVALPLRAAGLHAEVAEEEPPREAPFADAAQGQGTEVEEGVEAQEGEGAAHAVHLVEVGHGVGADGLQLAVDAPRALLLLHPEEVHVGHPAEEGLEQGRGGHGEAHVRIGRGHGA